MTFVEAELLRPEDRIIREEKHDRLIDYLQKYHPNGFEKPCNITINQKEIDLDDYDVKLKDDDVVVLIHHQGVSAAMVGVALGWGSVASWAGAIIANMAIGMLLSRIFAPSMPNSQSSLGTRNSAGKASSVYSLNSQQNEAKIGEVIPIIYGKVRTYPALISPPYARYEENEEYLYQLMCIGQGKFSINDLLISDTNVQEIQTDYFRHEALEYDDFKTPALFNAKVDDSNYHQLIKTIPDVENLEIRGTPQNQSMIMRFENSTITFYPYANGDEPDLSSLSNGSTITISNTVSNNGVYTVDFVTANVVTVQTHTFTTEPTDSKSIINESSGLPYYQTKEAANYFSKIYWYDGKDATETTPYNIGLGVGSFFYVSGATSNSGILFQAISETDYTPGNASGGRTNVDKSVVESTQTSGTTIFSYHAKSYSAEFETSYGAYLYSKEHIGFEIDYHYPAGVYNSNSTTGDLTSRTTQFNINYTEAGAPTDEVIETIAQDNSAIRATYKHIYTVPQSTASIRIKRITTEPSSVQSMDKTYIKSIKFIHADPDYEPLGDITLLWCKIRASNAISSVGQFAINAWVTRSDVLNDMNSVLTDLYTNPVYGGRLPLSELDFPATPTDFINGAIDSRMTLYDAMQMVAKSNRYSLYPVGGSLKLKHDDVRPIRTSLFNETNIIKDSLKISYLFTEVSDTDSVKIYYRDSTDFSEKTYTYPTTGDFPEMVEQWGNTDDTVAEDTARYLYKQDRSRRKTVEFKTDIQGLIPEYLDRIGISHDLPSWGIGGQVASFSGRVINLTCNYGRVLYDLWNCADTYACDDVFFPISLDHFYDTIIFRDSNGEVSDLLTFTVIADGQIELTTDAPTWLYQGEDRDKTYFSIGKVDSVVKDYIITNIKPNGKEVTITGVNYDETIFV